MTLDEFIIQEMDKRSMSMRAFANFIGVSVTTISNSVNPNKQILPSTDFLQKLANGTNQVVKYNNITVYPESADHSKDILAKMLTQRIMNLPPDKRKEAENYLDYLYSQINPEDLPNPDEAQPDPES